jgi:glycosyltransferase involved in cell wall biosynthesis
MNVLFVVPWDNLGGVCAVVDRVATHLSARGHSVCLLLPGTSNWPVEGVSRQGHRTFRLNVRPPSLAAHPLRSRFSFGLTLPTTLLGLATLVRRLRIDVVNVHFPDDATLAIALLRRAGVAKLVTSVHGADLLPEGRRHPGRQVGLAAALQASDLLISPSEAYRESVRSAWPELAGKRVTAIPNGIDLDELGAPVQVETTEAETPFILSILHLVHYKGVDVLIRAFAALSAAFPTYRLKLVSDGPQRAEYEALTRSLGIAERVEFLGIQQRPQVATLLKDCTIFVLPSRSDSESFGIAVAEAMALDRPVIVSRVGGLPELVDDEATGLLVPPGDVQALEAALRRLLGDAPARRRLGAAGGRKVRANFLWSNTQSRYEAALRGVLAQA